MKKFLFDTHDFDAEKTAPPPPPVTYSEEQLTQAKNQSFAQGKEEGIAQTRTGQEQDILHCLQNLTQSAGQLVLAEDRRELEQMMNATKLAMRVARKLMPTLSSRFDLPEIEQTIIAALAARREEPRITLLVPPAHLEALQERLADITHASGFAGKIALVADDTLAQTDCRIEWADGGAERLFEELFTQIETEFEKAIGGMKSTMNITAPPAADISKTDTNED